MVKMLREKVSLGEMKFLFGDLQIALQCLFLRRARHIWRESHRRKESALVTHKGVRTQVEDVIRRIGDFMD